MARRVVDVLVPVALDRTYSYRVPAALELAPGDIVTVPLGPRDTTGVVWAENANPNPRLHKTLKKNAGRAHHTGGLGAKMPPRTPGSKIGSKTSRRGSTSRR